MIVQIYGTKTIEDAEALAALGVDYIGLDVADDAADRALMKQIVDLVRDRMTTVLLPVFCDLEKSLKIVHELKPHVMHLCSTDMLSLDDLRLVKKELGEIKLLQAIPVGLPGRCGRSQDCDQKQDYDLAEYFHGHARQ